MSSQFGAHFQLSFLAFMVRDSEFLTKVAKHVKPEFFTDDGFQRVVRLVLGFYHEHHAAPDTMIYHELDNLMSDGLVSRDAKAIVEAVLQECFRHELNNKEYILEQYKGFLRASRIQAAFPAFAENVEKCNFDKAEEIMRGVLVDQSRDDDYTSMTAGELWASDIEVSYIVEGILAEGETCYLAGPSKMLKTSLAIDLGVAIVTGQDFLQRFAITKPCPVGMLSSESGFPKLKSTLQRVARWYGKQATDEDLQNLHISIARPQFSSAVDQGRLRRFIKDKQLGVLIIDPLYLCVSGEHQANQAKQGQEIGPIQQICLEEGCTLILVHHSIKSKQYDYTPAEFNDMSGAGHDAFARQWLMVSRRERYLPGTGEHKLWLTAGGSAGHQGVYGIDISEGPHNDMWAAEVIPYEQAVDEIARRNDRRHDAKQEETYLARLTEVTAFLDKHPEGVTKNQIKDGTSLGRVAVETQIEAMVNRNTAFAVKRENRGKTYTFYYHPSHATEEAVGA